jgi:hypothetical protein
MCVSPNRLFGRRVILQFCSATHGSRVVSQEAGFIPLFRGPVGTQAPRVAAHCRSKRQPHAALFATSSTRRF